MEDKNAGLRQAAFYFGSVMVVVYLALGAMFMFTSFLQALVPNNRVALGFFIFLYGLFRLYLVARLRKRKPSN